MSDQDAVHIHPKGPKQRTIGSVVGEWLGIIVGALLVAFLIKTFVFQTFFIPSASMENTLLIHDRVLVDKISYRVGDVHRSDIVVFKRPPLEADTSIDDLIKRVVAVPGDTVEGKDGKLWVNGSPMDETYTSGRPTADFPLQTVPEHKYWVMGDNRTNSTDSRVFGAIDKDLIVGKADLRWWPLARFDTI